MRIVICSSGRAHLLDSARELQKFGHKVTFLCATRPDTFKRYGLKQGGVNIVPFIYPFRWLSHKVSKQWAQRLYRFAYDLCAIAYLLFHRCDVFVCQRPYYKMAMKFAKKLWGATILLDSGSSHVRHFNDMKMIYEGYPQAASYIKHDESMYWIADYIVIGSDYVKWSFEKYGYPTERLFVNPYGVSLANFAPTQLEAPAYDVIMVGAWSKRKGMDLLVEACRNRKWSLLHVGGISDASFPNEEGFTHVGTVYEYELMNYYKRAKVFVLPSYDEGLALVQAQAIACGLPLVCSKNTGVTALRDMLADKQWVVIMDDLTVDALERAIEQGLKLADRQTGLRSYASDANAKMSWEAYGARYNAFLETLHPTEQ